MRSHGTLTRWNDERGFGFIQPSTGSDELFVHISAFPRDGTRPRIGEMVSFEVELREDGKRRAARLMRPGGKAASRHRPERHGPTSTRKRPASGWFHWIGLLLLGVVGYLGYTKLTSNQTANLSGADTPFPAHVFKAVSTRDESAASPFHCDGRKYCSNMTSCAEATYFVKHCPDTRMDGDGDGKPCESQWCTSIWSE